MPTYMLGVQVVCDGKIKQTWHLEDWSAAADQLVNGLPAPDFGFDYEYEK